MKIINLLENPLLLKEYIILCSKEWGSVKTEKEYEKYAQEKIKKILSNNYDKILSVLGLVKNSELIGFVSLFKYDGDERNDLTPWYATMYVKKEYRKKGYSKILNKAIIDKAKKLGFSKVYLKTDLNNYYEKYGAQYISELKNDEKLYYIDLEEI